MTIVNADAKGLEVVGAAYLSQDGVLLKELQDGIDIHGENQRVFGLPERVIAKILVFRILYGGNEYSFVQDPDFSLVSSNLKYWRKVIERFYNKYQGIAYWHTKIIQEATTTGKIIIPTGRVYKYTQLPNGDWPITTIKNYPVQGYGADVMAIIRVAFYKRWVANKFKGKLISTVHDSIVCDVPNEEVDRVAKLFKEVFSLFPTLHRQWFGHEFNLKLECEVSVGPNMKDLKEIV